MKISIIIPVYNADKTIISCLKSLYSQSCIPDEVIVVDNNSTDKTVQLVNYFVEQERITNLVLYHEVKRGQAAVRNRGINVSSGDIIAFLDSDCVAREDWVEQIKMVFIKDIDLDIVGGKFFSYQPKSLISKFLAVFWAPDMERVEEGQVNKKTDFFLDKYVHIFNSVFKKDILLKLKGFDEEMFPSGEDMDIWMRALDMGAKIIAWQPNIIIFHIQRETIKALIKQAFIYGESLAHFSKKHFGNKIIIPILPFHKIFSIKSPFTLVICPSSLKILSISLIFLLSLIFSLKTRIVILLLFFYIYFIIIQKIKDAKIKISFIEKIGLFFLFFIRELAEETGRIYGSLRYRVICL